MDGWMDVIREQRRMFLYIYDLCVTVRATPTLVSTLHGHYSTTPQVIKCNPQGTNDMWRQDDLKLPRKEKCLLMFLAMALIK